MVQVQDGEDLIQTKSSKRGPGQESSLEVECTRVGVQVDVKYAGESFGLYNWVDKEYWRQNRL